MPLPVLAAAAIPAAAGLVGGLLDNFFGDKPPSPERQLEMQLELDKERQQMSRYDISTPFGGTQWDGDTMNQTLSPQMQAMIDQQFAFRNQMMNEAMGWFGGESMGAMPAPVDTAGGVGPSQPTNTGYPGSYSDTDALIDWGEAMGWGDDPTQWGKDGNAGLPWWRVEQGKFPTNLDPGAIQTWKQNYGNNEFGPIATP